MSIVDAFKKGYFFFEDRYYRLLDKINNYVPVYKVIDPIDKVVPSFALFVAIVVLLALFFIFMSVGPAILTATIRVVDNKGQLLDNVSVMLTISGETKRLSTDLFGEVEVSIPGEETSADATFSKEGFQELERQLALLAGETVSVTLQPVQEPINLEGLEKTVKVVDGATSKLITKEVTLAFECGSGTNAPEPQTGTTGEFRVRQPANCPSLIATAEADGYMRKSKALTSSTTYIMLTPNTDDTTGQINVIVKDTVGNAEPDVVVRAISEVTFLEESSGSTTMAGTALLQDIHPGPYTISAISPDGRTGQETGITVTAGETTTVMITLPTPEEVEAKKIFLKLIEQGTTNPVANAQAFIYENEALIDSTTSDSLGIVEKPLTNPDSTYIVVLTHPDFVTKIEADVPLKDLADTTPINVTMVRSTMEQPNPTSGAIKVTVIDEELNPLENAQVTVYDADYPKIPLKVPPGRTIEDGTYTLQNLAPGNYLVKAVASESDMIEVTVVAGQTTEVDVMVVQGIGTVEATVFDAETEAKTPIQGAEVQFIDANGSMTVLSTCTTDATGKCESGQIKADRFVYVKASAPGFVAGFAAKEIDIVNRNKSRVSVGLVHESSIPSGTRAIDTRFRYFCKDRECSEVETKIKSDETGVKTYYAKIELLFTQASLYRETVQHVRLGPDNEIELPLPNDYKIKLMGVFGPLFTAAVLSDCWNNDASSPFTDPQGCSALFDAKQANVYYPSLNGKVMVPVIIEFAVEPGLEKGEKLEIHYIAKSTVSGQNIVTAKKVKYFLLDEVLCDDVSFAWDFSLTKPDGTVKTLDAAEGVYNEVEVNQAYPITYNVYNCSTRNYAGVNINAKSVPEEIKAISFKPLTQPVDTGPVNVSQQQDFSFPADTTVSNTFNIYTAKETETASLEISLTAGAVNSTESIGFKINSNKALRAVLSPTRLPPFGMPDLSGKVTDAIVQSTNIRNALVTLTVDGSFPRNAMTDANGLFSIDNIEGITADSVVLLTIRKAGYATFEKIIDVGNDFPNPNPGLDCVTIEKAGSSDVSINFTIGGTTVQQDTFNVVNGCGSAVVARLDSELVVEPSEEFTLGAGATRQATVKAETPVNSRFAITMGEYAVYVKARFEASDPLAGLSGPLATARIYVRKTGSMFRLADPADPNNQNAMKSTLDIKGGFDNGLVINKEFVYFEDLTMPRVEWAPGSLPAEGLFTLIYEPQTQPGQVIEKQRVDLNAQDLNDGRLEFNVIDSGGYVFLDWVDFFMGDGNHHTGDTHKVWAQTQRDVWTSVTSELPTTQATSGLDHYVVSPEGYVDTDVYHPSGAVYSTDLTTKSTWQAQHNVCNSNLDSAGATFVQCSVNHYFWGNAVTPYKLGEMANKIAIEAKGSNQTTLEAARWSYISTDKSHEGKIEFTVRNESLMGEEFAIVEVEDTTGVGFVREDDVEVKWVYSAKGQYQTEPDVSQTGSPVTVGPNEFLAVSADQNATLKFKVFSADSTLNDIYAEMAPADAEALDGLKGFTLKLSNEPQELEGSSVYFYVNTRGTWSPSLGEIQFEELGEEDFYDLRDPLEPEKPVYFGIIAFENKGPDPFTLDDVMLHYIKNVVETVKVGEGTALIPAGVSNATMPSPTASNLPSAWDYITYIIEDETEDAVVYFDDTKSNTTENPDALIVAATSSPETEASTSTERFHIRLVGESQDQCLGAGGLRGSTGQGAKPKVLLDWAWDSISMDSCDASNPNFIYCDPAQFTVSLIKRLDAMRRMAESGLDDQTLFGLSEMRGFRAYLIEDAYTEDFRNDFVGFYGSELLLDELTNPEYPWARYLYDDQRLVFDTSAALLPSDPQEGPDSKLVGAGLHDIYLDMSFDQDKYDFFYTQPDQVDLVANITVYISKVADPAVKSPFYYLPFNGNLGRETDGTFQRAYYGLVFLNENEPLAVSWTLGGQNLYKTDSPEGSLGRKAVGTLRNADFDTVNVLSRGMIMQVAQDQSQITFAPSIATPVLMEMIPKVGTAEAYYWLRDEQAEIPISVATFMNIWDGSGSTMKVNGQCVDFYGNGLSYSIPDTKAAVGTCAYPQQGSYGFIYEPAENSEKLYLETVFYVPTDALNPKIIHLRKSCENNSNFYSPNADTKESLNVPVPLSEPTSTAKVAAMNDLLGLVENSYVCISSDNENFSFWWNPQKILAELDSVKLGINPGWKETLDCTGRIGSGAT